MWSLRNVCSVLWSQWVNSAWLYLHVLVTGVYCCTDVSSHHEKKLSCYFFVLSGSAVWTWQINTTLVSSSSSSSSSWITEEKEATLRNILLPFAEIRSTTDQHGGGDKIKLEQISINSFHHHFSHRSFLLVQDTEWTNTPEAVTHSARSRKCVVAPRTRGGLFSPGRMLFSSVVWELLCDWSQVLGGCG